MGRHDSLRVERRYRWRRYLWPSSPTPGAPAQCPRGSGVGRTEETRLRRGPARSVGPAQSPGVPPTKKALSPTPPSPSPGLGPQLCPHYLPRSRGLALVVPGIATGFGRTFGSLFPVEALEVGRGSARAVGRALASRVPSTQDSFQVPISAIGGPPSSSPPPRIGSGRKREKLTSQDRGPDQPGGRAEGALSSGPSAPDRPATEPLGPCTASAGSGQPARNLGRVTRPRRERGGRV